MKLSNDGRTSFNMLITLIILILLSMRHKFPMATQLTCPDGFYSKNSNSPSRLPGSHIGLYSNSHTCNPCNCNQVGSLSNACNKSSGACYCVKGYLGLRCNKCSSGFVETEDEKPKNSSSIKCEECGECYKYWLIELEKLKLIGVDLIRKASNATRSRKVILELSEGKVIHFLNSSRFKFIDNSQREPLELDGFVDSLDILFLETKELSDKLTQTVTNLEDFLIKPLDHLVRENNNIFQIESLISSLNIMEDIIDTHIHSFNTKKELFDRLRQKNNELSLDSNIRSASDRSCMIASIVANLRKNHLEANGQVHQDESFHKLSEIQEILEELTTYISANQIISDKIEQVSFKMESVPTEVSLQSRKRMLKIYRDFVLMKVKLGQNLEKSRDLQEDFSKNGQILSNQYESLISLHKQMDEILQGLRYSQFRCDKFR